MLSNRWNQVLKKHTSTMQNFHTYFITLLGSFCLILELHHATGDTVPIVRGIPISKNPLYAPGKDFVCLDGSKTIPFIQVNDDYCDCADATDEPGTAACTNGYFYCQNLGS